MTLTATQSVLVVVNGLLLALVALGGLWIAGRQMVIAQQRLEHDIFYRLFDARFEVYKATRQFLARGFDDEPIPENDIQLYRLRTLEAKFLFNDEMANYLGEICRRVTVWQDAKSQLGQLLGDESDGGLEQIRAQNFNWIFAQGDERTGFQTRFESFLNPRKAKLPRWLSWPAPPVEFP